MQLLLKSTVATNNKKRDDGDLKKMLQLQHK